MFNKIEWNCRHVTNIIFLQCFYISQLSFEYYHWTAKSSCRCKDLLFQIWLVSSLQTTSLCFTWFIRFLFSIYKYNYHNSRQYWIGRNTWTRECCSLRVLHQQCLIFVIRCLASEKLSISTCCLRDKTWQEHLFDCPCFEGNHGVAYLKGFLYIASHKMLIAFRFNDRVDNTYA